jgi:hypothetical protein
VGAGQGGRREAVPKFLAVTRNRLEPFPGLRRLIVNPADMARIYSPDRRSRPPDPLRRSTRPARISPSGRVSFWATPIAAPAKLSPRRSASRPAFPLASARNGLSFSRDSGVPFGHNPLSARRCFRVPSTTRPTRSRRATVYGFPCRHGCLPIHSTRSRRSGALLPSAGARISSSCVAAGAGGTITVKRNSSTVCARPSA